MVFSWPRSGGHPVIFGGLGKIARGLIPDMEITFDETRTMVGGFFIDNSRLCEEFGFEHRTLGEGYRDLMNLTRKEAGLSLIGAE